MIIEGNKIRPSDGYKYVTNGEAWSDCAYLGIHDSADNWHDTNEDPPSPDPVDPETREIADLVEANYESCLEIIGGE